MPKIDLPVLGGVEMFGVVSEWRHTEDSAAGSADLTAAVVEQPAFSFAEYLYPWIFSSRPVVYVSLVVRHRGLWLKRRVLWLKRRVLWLRRRGLWLRCKGLWLRCRGLWLRCRAFGWGAGAYGWGAGAYGWHAGPVAEVQGPVAEAQGPLAEMQDLWLRCRAFGWCFEQTQCSSLDGLLFSCFCSHIGPIPLPHSQCPSVPVWPQQAHHLKEKINKIHITVSYLFIVCSLFTVLYLFLCIF